MIYKGLDALPQLETILRVIPAPWLHVGSTEAFVGIAHSLTSPPSSYPQAWFGFPHILQGVDLINMCQQTSGM